MDGPENHVHYVVIVVESGEHPPGYPDPKESFERHGLEALFAVCSLDSIPRPLS